MAGVKATGYSDLAGATYALDTTGSVTLLATVANGTSVTTRIGKKIAWKGLQIRGYALAKSAAVWNDCAVIIVYDRRPRGALPAVTDILDTASSQSMNKDANSGRFQIVRRWDFDLVGNTTTFESNTVHSFDQYVDLKGRKCVYEAAGTGAIGDISEGALYLVTVGNQAAGTSAADLNVTCRTRFIDIAG